MRILFVLDKRVDAGSIHAVANYVQAGDEAGYLVALYGAPDARYPTIRFSRDPASFDRVIFITETGLQLSSLQVGRLLAEVPCAARVIVDTDGMYNPLTILDDYDRNHRSERERQDWLARHALGDTVLQPTLERPGPGTLAVPFFGYDPALRAEPRPTAPACDIVYVGHNWWRWREMRTSILPAVESLRDRLGEICLIGSWWDAPPEWAAYLALERAFEVDAVWLRQLRIRTRPAVRYSDVVRTMSEGRVNIMLQRPLLRHLRLLTAKYFELFCAETIPLVGLDPDHAASIYGPEGRALALYPDVADRVADAIGHQARYRDIVEAVRQHLAAHHSYRKRLQELIAVLQSAPGASSPRRAAPVAATVAEGRGHTCD